MLRKYNQLRTFSDNLQLGAITALSAGMINVISVIVFFAFASNVTGHFAILTQEIAKGNWYQASVTVIWISLFFAGSFLSNLCVIYLSERLGRYAAHALPVAVEVVCVLFTGFYLNNYYQDSLQETEILVGVMLFAMGLQNGLTASISNFSIKTTHLTGLTTDLGILLSMLTRAEHRQDTAVVQRAQLLLAIMAAYLAGGTIAGITYYNIKYDVFYVVAGVLGVAMALDAVKLLVTRIARWRWPVIRKYYTTERLQWEPAKNNRDQTNANT